MLRGDSDGAASPLGWPADLKAARCLSVHTPRSLHELLIDGLAAELEAQPQLGWNVYSAFAMVISGPTVTLDLDLEGVTDLADHHLAGMARPTVRPDELTMTLRHGDEIFFPHDGSGEPHLLVPARRGGDATLPVTADKRV